MKNLIAILVAGIVVTALDYCVQGNLLATAYYSKMESYKQDTAISSFIIGDFVAVAVFAWVFCKVTSVFGEGLKGGVCAGFYLGVLVNFPTWHFVFLTTKGYPYLLSWINTGYGIVWYMVVGAIIGAMMKKSAPVSLTSPPH